jgi:cell division protein FtsI/penicillin-binding protein 2
MFAALGSSDAAMAIDARTRRVLAVRNEAAATRVTMPPGSTMKPLALAALLKGGALRPNESWPCPGALSIAGRQLNCPHPRLLAPMTIETALAYSCNCFVAHMAERLLPGELPYARRVSDTDAIRLQALGETGVSLAVSELAELFRQLALNAPPQIVAGLEGAVEYGTARMAAVAGVKVAGKTGTVRGAAWFAGWMPSRAPEVVIAVRVPGQSGGSDAAPVAAQMLKALR